VLEPTASPPNTRTTTDWPPTWQRTVI